MWSLQTLRQLMTSGYGTSINIPELVSDTNSVLRPVSSSALEVLLKGLPEMLLRQYEYEDPIVRGGKHLMHSTFFKELIALGCDLGLDSLPCCKETHKWAWFRRYCVAARVATALIHRTPLPSTFCIEVRKKIIEMVADDEAFSLDHESHAIFKAGHDEQLLLWLHRKPEVLSFIACSLCINVSTFRTGPFRGEERGPSMAGATTTEASWGAWTGPRSRSRPSARPSAF